MSSNGAEARQQASAKAHEALEEFVAYLTNVRRLSVHTVRAYDADLRAYLAWCDREGLDAQAIGHRRMRAYLADMVRAGYAEKTINRRMSSLRTFYGWMEREELVDTNAAASLAGRKLARTLPKTMSDEEALRIIRSCDLSTPEGVRDRAFLELLYATGARISEVAGLSMDDVDFDQGQVLLFGKRAKERIVPVYDAALQAVRVYVDTARPELATRHKGSGAPTHLFLSARGNDMSADALRARFSRQVRLAGLDPKLSPHAMRHTYATEMLSGGADLKTVQELLGHESLATTQIYTHVAVDRLKEVARLAHPRG